MQRAMRDYQSKRSHCNKLSGRERKRMEWIVPIIVGLFSLVGTIVSAFILHNKNAATLDLRLNHQTEVLDGQIKYLGDTLELKLGSLGEKVDDVKADVKCIDEKVEKNVAETGKIKVKVVALEKDVEALKKNNGVNYAKG